MTQVDCQLEIEDLIGAIGQESAWRWMVKTYLPPRPICPGCQTQITGSRAISTFWKIGRVYCRSCKSTFRPTVGTPIHETSWSPEEYVKLLFLIQSGRSISVIATALGKSPAAVRDMRERIALRHSAHPTDQLTQLRDKKGARGGGRGQQMKSLGGHHG